MSETEAPAPRTHNKRRLFSRPLEQCIAPVARQALEKRGFSEMTLFKHWPQIVGKKLASRCLPEKLSINKKNNTGGVLHIRAGGNWALELQHLEPVLLERIATYFGYRAVSRIAITQAAIPAKEAPMLPDIAPLQQDKAAQLDNLLGGIDDADLRERMRSLGTALASRNKLLKDR